MENQKKTGADDWYGSRMASGSVMATPASSMANLMTPQPMPSASRPTPLRTLPGYAIPKGRPTDSGSTVPAVKGPNEKIESSTSEMGVRRPYKNRERLFWETDDAIHNVGDEDQDTKLIPVLERLAEDAPPTATLYELDNTLTPERKYLVAPPPTNTTHEKEDRSGIGNIMSLTTATPIRLIESKMEVGEGNWVTVFGFAASQSTAVLEYFNSLGVIDAHEPGQGNWMHMKYSTLWGAQKALAKNGTVLPIFGTCMIGVVPANRAVENVKAAAESFMSPIKKETLDIRKRTIQDTTIPQDIFLKTNLMSPRPTTTASNRPTRDESAFRTPAPIKSSLGASTDIFRDPPTAPTVRDQKQPPGNESEMQSQSLLSKAVSLVLGW